MNKLIQPVPDDDELFGPELSEAEMEAWIARNRDAINGSIREARQEFAEGKAGLWNSEEIIAGALKRLAEEDR
jgi:antitoxin ParD1/3/4